MFHDLRHGLRGIARKPALAAIIIATLGLAIGANTAIFTVVNAVLLKPLPFAAPEGLVRVYTAFHTQGQERYWLSAPELVELRRDARSFSAIAGWTNGTATFGEIDRPVRVDAAYATPELAAALGVAPALGRFFGAEDAVPGQQPRVAVIAHELWQRAFGGASDIIGRKVTLDGVPVTVIGVMPPGFGFPDAGIEAWVPIAIDGRDLSSRRASHYLSVLARLAPGVSLEAARAELAGLNSRYGRLDSETWHAVDPGNHPLGIRSLTGEIVGAARAPLWLLQIAALFVLLIACANVGNLLLGRAEARSREIAVRVALGAGRGRLVRLFLAESALLALAAAGLGVALAAWGVDVATTLIPAGSPRVGEIHLDGGALAFALGCAVLVTLTAGLTPLGHTRGVDLTAGLKDGRGAGAGSSRLRRFIVIAEVAVAIVLAIGCGLTLRSFAKLSRVDAGFRPEGLLTFELEVPEVRYQSAGAVLAFWSRLEATLAVMPGVDRVTLASGLPPAQRLTTNVLWYPGAPPFSHKDAQVVDFWSFVGDGHAETLGLRLLAGRTLGPADQAAVVVNQALARKFYPGVDAVGKPINLAPYADGVPMQTIVGVVADVKQQGPGGPTGTEAYIPLRFAPALLDGRAPLTMRVVVRGVRPAALAGTVEAAVRGLDPALPLSKVRTMEDSLWESVARPRFLTVVVSIFGGLALLLAVLGVYSVMAIAVTQRTRELGIRMALGAREGGIVRLVLRQGMIPVAAGIVVGLGATLALNLALARVLAGVLYDTPAIEPLTFLLMSALVAVVAALACWLPARRAARVDPMIALRAE